MNELVILGASVRAAAQSAARAGFAPYAIDCFADRDLVEICPATRIDNYPQGFWRAMAAAPDAPWMYTGGLENYPRLVERLARWRPLWGNSADVLRQVRNPWQVHQSIATAGLSMPGPNQIADRDRVLIKPLCGSAGLGIRWADARYRALQPPRGTYYQRYIKGLPASAAFVAANGKAALLGATRQILGRGWNHDPPFLYVGSIGPLPLPDVHREQIVRIGEVIAEQFRLVGLFGVDLVMDGETVWTIEVNPRYTASMEILERVTGESFIAMHAAACQSGQLPHPPRQLSDANFRGKAVVYARQELTIGDHMPWDDRAARVQFADLPHAGQTIQAGHPIVTVFAEGDSPEVVESLLHAKANSVRAIST